MYIPTRTIYIGSAEHSISEGESGVDGKLAERAIKALHILDLSAPTGDQPISIILNNPGGDTIHGMSIYDSIRMCKNHITVRVQGYGMSIAAWILQAADHRVMTKHSRLMLHAGTYSLPDNHPETNRRWSDYMIKDEEIFETIILEKIRVKHPEYTKKQVKSLLRFDTILMPEAALELGLVDEIV